MNVKLIMRATYSLEAIYQLRKAPFILTLLMILIIGVLHFMPFTLSFIGVDPYVRHVEQIWELTSDEQQQLIQALPTDCKINELQLTCDNVGTYHISPNFSILINHEDIELENGLIFLSNHFKFVGNGGIQEFSYFHLEGLDFEYLQNHPQGYDLLINGIAQALRGVLILPFIIGSYMTGIISFLGYILGISILSMLLKFGHPSFPKYTEVLSILVYSAILPTLVVVVIGFFTPVFTTIIPNLAIPVISYLVYKRYVIPDLQNISIKNKGVV